uniref:Uncharacterized protein n=1 Tax=Lepeophtheirus salmonis TaxID=72036 RepID=A0A0K2UJ66_LEPSM
MNHKICIRYNHTRLQDNLLPRHRERSTREESKRE